MKSAADIIETGKKLASDLRYEADTLFFLNGLEALILEHGKEKALEIAFNELSKLEDSPLKQSFFSFLNDIKFSRD